MSKDRPINLDAKTVEGFGDEWSRFDQTGISDEDAKRIFDDYFSIFPWSDLPADPVGFDLGCGSGRWAKLVAPRVYKLYCIDPSNAIDVARKNLSKISNCVFHRAGVDDIPLDIKTMDFGYSLGVLHHIPDTASALRACVSKLKPGAPFLIYLYYAFDNRPFWFRWAWNASELMRAIVSRLPYQMRYGVSQIIALLLYWPLARLANFCEKLRVNVSHFPLSFYRNCGFYVMRTDALDRFGTRLEQRFTKLQIAEMMKSAGLDNISFSDKTPYWCAVGYAKKG